MGRRTAIPDTVQADLLVKTRRRCCLCVYLDGSRDRKRVQIAHIDHDPSNAASDNLVPLCLDHHDEYDSTTRQSKGVMPHELRAYKYRLMDEVAAGNFEAALGKPSRPALPLPLTTSQLRVYGTLYSAVLRVLLEYDPAGINLGENPDEYEAEASDIISELTPTSGIPSIAEVCTRTFAKWFSPTIAEAYVGYVPMATKIYRYWSRYLEDMSIYVDEPE